MEITQKANELIKYKSVGWLARQLNIHFMTLTKRMEGATDWRLSESVQIEKMYKDLKPAIEAEKLYK